MTTKGMEGMECMIKNWLELHKGDRRATYARVECPTCKETRPMEKSLVAFTDPICCARPLKPSPSIRFLSYPT